MKLLDEHSYTINAPNKKMTAHITLAERNRTRIELSNVPVLCLAKGNK